MTDLKYRILSYIHEHSIGENLSETDIVNQLSDEQNPPVKIHEVIRELLSSHYLSCNISGDDYRVRAPEGILALEAEEDLRRKEHIAQQQMETQLHKEAEQKAAQENERKRDRHIMLLAAFIGAGGAILGGLFTALAEYVLPLLFGT